MAESSPTKTIEVPDVDHLVKLYQSAMSTNSTAVADFASEALKSIARAEGSAAEARMLAGIGDNM